MSDWMALQDSELTQEFEIRGEESSVMSSLNVRPRHGKECNQQRLTVSLLLPGRSTADQWLDFLQSQRQFWPTMTGMPPWPHSHP